MFTSFRLFVVIAVFVTIIDINHASSSFNPNDVSTWFNYDISKLESSDSIKTMIEKANQELDESGSFIIPQFLKSDIKNLIAMELRTVEHIPRKTTRTVFQDQGDFDNFDESSPRNFMLDNSMEFVSRLHIEKVATENDIKSHMISLYDYPPLLQFWRKIINSTELYLSTDEAGSVYGFYGRPKDWFSWHFDESPFSCIYMIEKPEIGGFMRYIVMDNPLKTPNIEWDELGIVLNDEDSVKDRIVTMNVNEGDVYCIFGNQTLHEITKVDGTKDRSVFVMTYGNNPHFEHTHNVHNLNQWNVDPEKQDL